MIEIEHGRGFDEAVAGLKSTYENLKKTADNLRKAAINYSEAANKIRIGTKRPEK